MYLWLAAWKSDSMHDGGKRKRTQRRGDGASGGKAGGAIRCGRRPLSMEIGHGG